MDNISVQLYMYFDNKDNFDYEYETYDCDVLFILERGEFVYIDEKGERVTVNQGETVFCPRKYTFRRYVNKSISLHMIKFSYNEAFSKTTGKYRINSRMKEDLERLKILWEKARKLDFEKIHYCSDFVREMLISHITPRYPSSLNIIIKYISDNICRSITNKELCDISFLSETSVISLMKRYFNKTPNEYITWMRITMSQKLLSETDSTVKSIAFSVGFNDNLYFSKVFKKYVGITPIEFRKKYSL